MKRKMILAAMVAGGMALGAMADDKPKTLTVGDDAPAIEVSHWVKGPPVDKFEQRKVYVVEFWATWCGPCKASMPHISGLQEEYKDYDVQFVGISDEELPTVVGFLVEDDNEGQQWYEKMGYTVATDPDRSVFNDYMKAAGQNGIPTAFIVGKTGKIEWIGHPMNIDEPIKRVVNDDWDRAAYLKKFEEQEKAQRKFQTLMQSFQEAEAQGEWTKAIRILDDVIAMGDQYSGMKAYKFQILIGSAGQPKEGYAFGEQLVKENWDDAQMLNSIAWFVVDDASVKDRDLNFAMKVAKRASDLTDDSEPSILDTYARVLYEKGDLKSAIKWQRKAVENATEGPMADGIRKTLAKYEKEAGDGN